MAGEYSLLPTILVAIITAGLILAAILVILRDRRNGRSSCGGCDSCPMAGRCHSEKSIHQKTNHHKKRK